MTPEQITALLFFAFVSSITPGPNNFMLMTSAANFGLRRTVPHILGIFIGFVSIILLTGAGLTSLFARFPITELILKAICATYLVWLVWKIVRADAAKGPGAAQKPLSLAQAMGFQWVNPKGWAMAISAITVYAQDGSPLTIALTAALFGLMNLPCIFTWALLGQQMARFLGNERRRHRFNLLMGGLLILSLYPILLP